VVVAALRARGRVVTRAQTGEPASSTAYAGADGGSGTAIHGSTDQGPDSRPSHCASHGRIGLRARGCGAPDRVGSVLAAGAVILLKLLEAFVRARQGERARTCRDTHAAAEKGGRNDYSSS